MRRYLVGLLVLVMLLGASPLYAAPKSKGGATAAAFTSLAPGQTAQLSEQVPVNIVLLGYEGIDEAEFEAALPQSYKPVVRSRLWYGVEEELGITYTYDYNFFNTDAAYEEQFFAMLSSVAQPADLTLYQNQYNAQKRNALDISENHFIDAPTVEKWLAEHPPAGVDTARNTVFFINWWGSGATPREGFKHHIYTKIGEPDPDTGYDFGLNRQSRKIIAWGGTTADDEETGLGSTQRIWFHDLSAGPEYWTDNWNVDNADLDGDRVADYRMPPVWEYYLPNGNRTAGQVTGDLAKLTRFVAINLLFTSSPLYPPSIATPNMPDTITLNFTTYEGSKAIPDGSLFQTPDLAVQELSEVHHVGYDYIMQDAPLTKEAWTCFVQSENNSTPCYDEWNRYPSWANLYLYNAVNLHKVPTGGGQYQGYFFNYVSDDNHAPAYLGYADDNWIDGTQSFTFNALSPGVVAAGYGLTTTQIHEYGHHFGMSHPHDGWDSELKLDYGPGGEFYFVGAGDEVNSMMSYIDLNWDYSQFDRDNANRFQAAAYITNANYIASLIPEADRMGVAAADLTAADAHIAAAQTAMAGHDYAGTLMHARLGYKSVLDAAAKAGVTVEPKSPNGWTLPSLTRGGKPMIKKEYSFKDKAGPGSKRWAE